MAELAVQKDVPKLKAGDRISIIKNKPSFSLVFSVIILVLIVALFGGVTKGAFFGRNVLMGIFNHRYDGHRGVLYLYDGEPGYFRGELHGAGGYHRRADL